MARDTANRIPRRPGERLVRDVGIALGCARPPDAPRGSDMTAMRATIAGQDQWEVDLLSVAAAMGDSDGRVARQARKTADEMRGCRPESTS